MEGGPPPGEQTQSVARAVALVRCFAETDDGLTLSELARRTDMNPSTALRLLRTLCASGMLHRADGSERYERGPLLVRLAHRVYASHARDDVRAVLEGLVARTRESASFGHREGARVVVVMHVESDHPLRFHRPEGARVPLHYSAMGKALLAWSPEPLGDTVRGLGPLEKLTARTLTGRRLEQNLREAHERGWALVDEEQFDGVRSIGAPILDDHGDARAAVAIQGPADRLTDARLGPLADAVVDAARAIAALRVLPD